MSSFRKTQHFLLRQWERHIDDIELNKILKQFPSTIKQKTHVFVSPVWLRKLKIKARSTAALVIVVGKRNALITIFITDDFWTYIQTSTINASYYIQHKNNLNHE